MTPKITEGMFAAASRTLAGLVSPAERKMGKLIPEISQMRKVSEEIAFAVAREARESGLGVRLSDEKLREMTRQSMWDPKYLPYRRAQTA